MNNIKIQNYHYEDNYISDLIHSLFLPLLNNLIKIDVILQVNFAELIQD